MDFLSLLSVSAISICHIYWINEPHELVFSSVGMIMCQSFAFQVFGDETIIAGGFVESIYHKKRSYTKGICGLVFSGDLSANMRIHKTKRSQHGGIDSDRHAFVENLQALSASSPHRHFSVMFMFSCVARGYEYFSEHNHQTKLVSQVFPRIPVFGMFAFGEIGYNGLQFAKESSSSCHSYSTVLCLCRF